MVRSRIFLGGRVEVQGMILFGGWNGRGLFLETFLCKYTCIAYIFSDIPWNKNLTENRQTINNRNIIICYIKLVSKSKKEENICIP